MGGSTSEPQFKQLSSYKVIQKYPQYNVTHLSHIQTDRQYVLRQLTYNDQGLYKNSFTEHKQRQTITDDHLTHLVRVYEKEVDHLCSNLYKIYAIWQYPYRFLNDQINQRSYQHRKFQEKQIWSILASAILGLSTLQKNKIKHQMLSTKTILLDSDGIIKIADPLACGHSTNLQTIQRNRNSENTYLSPQQCQSLQSRVIYNNSYKSDVWIIGMIILQCGLLNSMSKCYKDQFQRIDYILLNKKLAQFGQQYGDQLKTILENMLRKDHKDRPDWVDLESYARKSRSPPTYSSANKVEESGNKSNLSPLKKQEYSSYMTLTQPQKTRQTYEINTKALYIPNKQLAPTINNTQLVNTTSNYISPPSISSSIPSNYTPKFTTYPQTSQIQTHSYSNSLHQPAVHFSVGGVNTQNYNTKPSSFTQQSYVSNQATYSGLPSSHFIYKSPQLPVSSQPLYKGLTNNLYGDSKAYDWKKPSNYYSLNPSSNPTLNQDSIKKDYLGQNQIFAPPISFSQQNSFTPTNNFSGAYSNQALFKQPNFQENLFTPLAQLYPASGGTTSKQQQKVGSFYQQRLGQNEGIQNSSNRKKQQEKNQLFGNQNRNLENLSNFVHTTQQNNIPISETLNKETQNNQSFLNNTTQNDQPVQVVQKFKQGSRYEGYKWKGMRHGQGKFYYQDGGMYDGNWTLNKMDGFGSLYYQSGQLAYQGFWKDDQFQGKGKLFNEYPSELESSFNCRNFDQIEQFWSYYDGQFVEDFKKGRGILMLSNGEYLEGTFDNDMVEGPGQFHCKDGRVIKGVWKQNHLIQR